MSGEFNFACDKCPRTFKLEEFYDKHKKVHDLKKQHKCDICGFVYGAAKGLEGHIKTHTDDEIAAAHSARRKSAQAPSGAGSPGSNAPFGVDFHFLNPQGVLAQAKKPVSPKKEDEVVLRDQLNGKAPSPAGTGNYVIYNSVPEVNDASAAVQNDSGFFMCSICKREFSGLNSLKKHIPIHTRKIQHKCDVCGYVFGKKEYLLDHMRLHTGEVSPICEVCGQTFNKSLKLKEHFKLHRNTGPNSSMSPYKCHVCSAVFARPDVLGNHLTVAHAETVYKCDICEATFGDVRGKNHHMYNEHKLDAFHQKCVWCPVCNQGFTRHYNLKVHMYKSHGKEYIENNFSPAELAALMKSVPSPPLLTNLKPEPLNHPKKPLPPLDFNCNMCGSKFLNRNKLLIHMQSHGVILVPCPSCNDKFMSQIELQAHINSIHKKNLKKTPMRKPGPASKTNAPPEKRGSTSLPTYLQLTQVSRRSSTVSTDGKKDGKESSLADIVQKLAAAAASKALKADEKASCNFCPMTFRSQFDLSQHLVNDHFKGLIPSPIAAAVSPGHKCNACPRSFAAKDQLEAHVKVVHRAKQIRRSLGLDEGPAYRRPGPKSARARFEGTFWPPLKAAIRPPLPSSAVLSASRITSMVDSLRPVVLSSSISKILRPPKHVVNMMLDSASSNVAAASKNIPVAEDNNNNNNNAAAHNQLMLSINAMKSPRKKSECPVCGIILSPKTNVNVHLRTHSGVRPYECVLCLNRFRQKAHLMKHFRCTHNQKQPPHICLFCSVETATSNDLYRHITDQHQKETDDLRPSLLAARSDAAAAAKEAAAAEMAEKEEAEAVKAEIKEEEEDEAEVRYEPITEDFLFEDMVISPCYVVLPFISEEEVEAACHVPDDTEEEMQQDYLDDEAPLTIDESIVDDEPELPRSPIKGSDNIPDEIIRNSKAEYNAEDINEEDKDGGFYPAMADYSLPFSMANIWKKKADELGNFNAMEHLALMEKIEQMQKYNGSVVYSGPPSPPNIPIPTLVNNGHHESPKKPKKPNTATSPNTPKEKKFISTGNNQTPVADYENQIKNDIWPLDCIKCNSLLGNLDNFNLHMNDHWSDDKCCPVCGLLINSKRFNFKQHLKIHTGEKPFTCNICNRSFRQKAHMVKHVTTHRSLPNGTASALALEAK